MCVAICVCVFDRETVKVAGERGVTMLVTEMYSMIALLKQ